MENLKHLKTFEQFSDTEELNEGLFGGLNKEQEAKVIELAGKGQLEDADVADTKLIAAVMNSFKPAISGQNADISIKAKNTIVANPSSDKETVLKFLQVYAKSLTPEGKKLDKLYSYNPNLKKLQPRLGSFGKPGVAAELGQ